MAYKTIGGIGWKDDLDDNFTSLQLIAFAGAATAGACTATGLKVGDKILSVTGVAAGTVGTQAASFETAVTVADQIQQSSSSNLSSNVYLALVLKTN